MSAMPDITPRAAVQISPLVPDDRAGWEPLARGYKRFYRTPITDAELDTTFARLLAGEPLLGLAARRDGRVVGIAHALFHATVWAADACYLQDLFVDEAERGHGIAAALIEHLAQSARGRRMSRLYWLTHHENARARGLYDRVARWHGFIRYEYPLQPA